MRIIGGRYRSRKIHLSPNLKARPTTDFAKEGLFNIVNNLIDWPESVALDLFSGTGSIAFELVSRGCKKVITVEKENIHWRFISQTKEKLNATELIPIRADVFKFIDSCREQFDLIFADPPWDLPELNDLPTTIFEKNLLKPGAILIIEHSKKINLSQLSHFSMERKYGSVHFSFFKAPSQ